MDARISESSVNYITRAVETSLGDSEIGGILLGTRTDNEIEVIKSITISSVRDSSYYYMLDGDKASELANESEYDFVGIWHSHINSCRRFSESDQKINSEFAELFGGVISILIVSDGNKPLEMLAYLIEEDGESRCIMQNHLLHDGKKVIN